MEGSRFSPKGTGIEGGYEFDPPELTPERKKIKPELTIIVPEDFELREDDLRDALTTIVENHQQGDSIEELRAKGLDYLDKRVYPTPIFIRVQEIVGTESKNGWEGLVKEIGQPDKHTKPQSLKTVSNHAQQLIAADQDERNKVLNGIELVMNGRKFFVDSDGRHRILTLKALAQLRCDVTISGMKVAELG